MGKITLKMSLFMEESGDSTVRKGETMIGKVEENGEKAGISGLQKRNGVKSKKVDDMKCLRLEGSQYLAKLRFKCRLLHSAVSKLPMS
jgi:hypothetical protein